MSRPRPAARSLVVLPVSAAAVLLAALLALLTGLPTGADAASRERLLRVAADLGGAGTPGAARPDAPSTAARGGLPAPAAPVAGPEPGLAPSPALLLLPLLVAAVLVPAVARPSSSAPRSAASRAPPVRVA